VQFEGRAALTTGIHGSQWISEITMPEILDSPERAGVRRAARWWYLMKCHHVDDELAGRRTLRELCEAEGDLKVIGEYGDGAAALEAIRAMQPQLLFLDIQMDPLNGIDLARAWIRQASFRWSSSRPTTHMRSRHSRFAPSIIF